MVHRWLLGLTAAALALAGTTATVSATATVAVAAPVGGVPQHTVGFNAPVHAVAYAGDAVLVGGEFTLAVADGHRTARAHLAAIDATSGALLPWNPGANGTVYTLAADRDTVYAGGDFSEIGGANRRGLARLSVSSGRADRFAPQVTGGVRTVSLGDGRLYAGGLITSAGDERRSALAAFSTATGAVDRGWAPLANLEVNDLWYSGRRVYVAGAFTSLGDSRQGFLVGVDPVDGSVDHSFAPGVRVLARGVITDDTRVYAALGGGGGRLEAFDAAGRSRWHVTTDGDVQTVAVLNGTVYGGGHFDYVCRSTRTGAHGVCRDGSSKRHKLFAADARTGRLSPWAPQANGVIGVISLAASAQQRQLAVGGTFTTLGDGRISQYRYAQFS